MARGALHGLELAAIAVVAQAVWSMARQPLPGHAAPGPGAAGFSVLWLLPDYRRPDSGPACSAPCLGGWSPVAHRAQPARRHSRHDQAPCRMARRCSAWRAFLLLLVLAFLAPHNGCVGAVRGILPRRRSGLRRRPCRPALVARCSGRAGLGPAATISCRVRRGAGHAGPALHRRGLSRRGEQRRPERRAGCPHRHTRDLPPGLAAGRRRPALLANIQHRPGISPP